MLMKIHISNAIINRNTLFVEYVTIMEVHYINKSCIIHPEICEWICIPLVELHNVMELYYINE